MTAAQPRLSFPKEKIKILLVENIHPAAVREFELAGYTNIETHKKALSADELMARMADVHIIGLRSKTKLTAAHIAAAPKLLAIGAFCIGTDQIALAEAAERGIAVFNSPYSSTRSVAELTIGSILHLLRRVEEKSTAAHKGLWLKSADNCFEARGKVLGIVGYGRIGTQVSVLAESLGMRVRFYDKEPKMALGNAAPAHSLEELLAEADIVTLHVPDTAQTRGLIGAEQLALMKPSASLINYARGHVVQPDAVADAVRSKQIAGCAMDVFPKEPASDAEAFAHPLQGLPNVILTPHIGGSTQEAQEAIGVDAATKIIQFLDRGTTFGCISIPELNLPMQDGAYRILHIHYNRPGVLRNLNDVISSQGLNILGQYLKTNEQHGYVVLDVDRGDTGGLLDALRAIPHTVQVRLLF